MIANQAIINPLYKYSRHDVYNQSDSTFCHLIESAYRCEDEGKHDSAIVYFEKAGAHFKDQRNWPKYVECLAGENRNYLYTVRIKDVEAIGL
jgi:hypothetical protein